MTSVYIATANNATADNATADNATANNATADANDADPFNCTLHISNWEYFIENIVGDIGYKADSKADTEVDNNNDNDDKRAAATSILEEIQCVEPQCSNASIATAIYLKSMQIPIDPPIKPYRSADFYSVFADQPKRKKTYAANLQDPVEAIIRYTQDINYIGVLCKIDPLLPEIFSDIVVIYPPWDVDIYMMCSRVKMSRAAISMYMEQRMKQSTKQHSNGSIDSRSQDIHKLIRYITTYMKSEKLDYIDIWSRLTAD